MTKTTLPQVLASHLQAPRTITAPFVTRDGVKLVFRLIKPSDQARLIDFFYALSPESRRRRFHIDVEHVSSYQVEETSHLLCQVDNRTNGGAVLVLEGKQIVGVARLARPLHQPTWPEAEAAIVIRDDYHGHGVGTALLQRLVLLAHSMGITCMIAEIEADNHEALRLFRGLKLPTETTVSHGEMMLRIQLAPQP